MVNVTGRADVDVGLATVEFRFGHDSCSFTSLHSPNWYDVSVLSLAGGAAPLKDHGRNHRTQ
jgi:hypothetical protein